MGRIWRCFAIAAAAAPALWALPGTPRAAEPLTIGLDMSLAGGVAACARMDIEFGPNGEWAEARRIEVRFQGVEGNGIDRFKTPEVIAAAATALLRRAGEPAPSAVIEGAA